MQILLFIVVGTSSAQSNLLFQGRVSSDDGGLIGAHILEFSTKKTLGFTGVDGAFKVYSNDSMLLITMVGFDSALIIQGKEFYAVKLNASTSMLDQVIIGESKTEKQLKNTTVSLDLIRPELIENTAPIRIQESLNRLNGVQIVDNQANIRSGSGWSYGAGSRVQVLVNGLPMLSGDAGQPQWSFVPTEGVSSVEVLKGASSVIYGSSALNGVINIKTKTHSVKPYTHLSLSTGFYDEPKRKSLLYRNNYRTNLSNVSAFHVSKIGKTDMSLGLNALNDGGYKMNDDEQRARTTFGLRRAIPTKNVIIGINTALQMGISNNFLLWDSYKNGYSALDDGSTKTNTFRFALDPYFTMKKKRISHSFTGRYLRVGNKIEKSSTGIDQSNFSDLFYTEYRFGYHIPKVNIDLTAGAVGQWSKTSSPLFNGNQVIANGALYTQLERKFNKLLVNAGVRHENYRLNRRKENKPVFRAGLNYELFKYTFVRLSYGQGYRFPSIAETYITTSVGPVSIFPNRELKSESGSNIEFGIKQAFKIKRFKGMLDLAVYQMQFNNMTEFTFAQWMDPLSSTNFGLGFKSINTGMTQINGLEVSTVFAYEKDKLKINGFVGYNYNLPVSLNPDKVVGKDYNSSALTYRNTSTETKDNILKYRPLHNVKGDVIAEYKNFTLGYGLAYQTKMINIDTAFVSGLIELFVPGVDSAMNMNLSAFLIQNMRFGYKVNNRLKLNLVLGNVFNREYMIRPADLGEPRSVRLQISYTFK